MDDGEYVEIAPDEIFYVPRGHDAWVLGDEPAIILDFFGNIEQLGRPASKHRIVTTLLMIDVPKLRVPERIGSSLIAA